MKYNFEKATEKNVDDGLVQARNTSLNGHLGILYDEIIEVFGEPTWSTDSEAHRTRREWELIVELDNGDDIGIDIYDYKDNENGFEVDEIEAWHVASERTSTDGVEKIDAVAVLQQIVQDHRRLKHNDFPENPSFESIMSTGTYADQLLAIQKLMGDSEIKEIGVTDNYGIAEPNYAYYTTYSSGVSYEHRIMYLDDDSGVEEEFEVAQAENGLFEWNQMGNKMINGYKANEGVILVDYPGLNGYNAVITNLEPEGYSSGTMEVWVEDAIEPDIIKSDRFVSKEEYQFTLKQAHLKVIQKIELEPNEDELSISDKYWSLVKSIEELNSEGSTDFLPDVSDHFSPSDEAQDMAVEDAKVFYLTVPVTSTYSVLSSSVKQQKKNLEKDIYSLELYKGVDVDSTTAVETFETEVVLNFANKEDFSKFVDKSLFENTDFAFENYASKHWEDMTRENIRDEIGTENWPYDISVRPSLGEDDLEFRMKFKSDGDYASKGVALVAKTLDSMGIDGVEIVETMTMPDDKEHYIVNVYSNGLRVPTKGTKNGADKTTNPSK
jgi:hypothetical protein